jgi:membrane protein YdbS with pleckstrin-like domain
MFDDYPESKYAIRDKDIPKRYWIKFILILLVWIGLDVLIVVCKSYLPLWLAGMSIILFIPISIMSIFIFIDPKTGKFTTK